MRETIYTIPINEAFEERSGCPLCTLRRKLEDASLDYIMGDAMMEPNVRIETNRRGFCGRHYSRMLDMNGRLSLALTLESRISEILDYIGREASSGLKKQSAAQRAAQHLHETAGGCFVCERIAVFEEHYYKNILYMWKNIGEFRESFAGQPYFCLTHTEGLLSRAPDAIGKKYFADFAAELLEVTRTYLSGLKEDISDFCRSFDYRNAGQALSPEKSLAPERAIEFLSDYRGRSDE